MNPSTKRCFLVGRLERGGRVVVLRPSEPALAGPWTVRAVVARA